MKWLVNAWRWLRDWRLNLTCRLCGLKIPFEGDRQAQHVAAYHHWVRKHSGGGR